jgi:drug/metabolite transporter (DMT)-like permease
MMFGGLWMLPLVPFLYRPGELAAASHVTHAAFAFLVLFSSVIAYLLWGYALERASAARVAVFSNLQPVATAVCGWALLNEPIGWEVIAGGLLVMAGVRLAQR